MPDPWTYESKTLYQTRQAAKWAEQARTHVQNLLEPSNLADQGLDPSWGRRPPTMFDQDVTKGIVQVPAWVKKAAQTYTSTDSGISVPKKKHSGLLNDIFSTAGDILEVPLKPILRLQKWETDNISRPTARTLYSAARAPANELGAGLPEYSQLPGVLRMGLEATVSPSTWLTPALLGGLTKALPRVLAGLPAAQELVASTGSRGALMKALETLVPSRLYAAENIAASLAFPFGQEAARQIGAPPIVGGFLAGGAAAMGTHRIGRPAIERFTPDDIGRLQTAVGKTHPAGQYDYILMSDTQLEEARKRLGSFVTEQAPEYGATPEPVIGTKGTLASSGFNTTDFGLGGPTLPEEAANRTSVYGYKLRSGTTGISDFPSLKEAETLRGYGDDTLKTRIESLNKARYDAEDAGKIQEFTQLDSEWRKSMTEAYRRGLVKEEQVPWISQLQYGGNMASLVGKRRTPPATPLEAARASDDLAMERLGQQPTPMPESETSKGLSDMLILQKVRKGTPLTPAEAERGQAILDFFNSKGKGPESQFVSGKGPDFNTMSNEELRGLAMGSNKELPRGIIPEINSISAKISLQGRGGSFNLSEAELNALKTRFNELVTEYNLPREGYTLKKSPTPLQVSKNSILIPGLQEEIKKDKELLRDPSLSPELRANIEQGIQNYESQIEDLSRGSLSSADQAIAKNILEIRAMPNEDLLAQYRAENQRFYSGTNVEEQLNSKRILDSLKTEAERRGLDLSSPEAKPDLSGVNPYTMSKEMLSTYIDDLKLYNSGRPIVDPRQRQLENGMLRIAEKAYKARFGGEGGPGTPRAYYQETPTMQRILMNLDRQPDVNFADVRPGTQIVQEAADQASITRSIRSTLGDILPEDWQNPEQATGPRPPIPIRLRDTDANFLLDEYSRLNSFRKNFAASAAEQVRIAAESAFKLDKDGRVIDLPGMPYIEDVIRNRSAFQLTSQQDAAVEAMLQPIRDMQSLEQAFEIPTSASPIQGGEYFPIEPTMRPIQARGVTIQAPAKRPSNALGAKQTFQRTELFPTKEEGVTAGLSYMHFQEAVQARLDQGMKSIADKWLKESVKVYGKTAKQLVDQGLILRESQLKNLSTQAKKLERQLIDARRISMTARPQMRAGIVPSRIRSELRPIVEKMIFAESQPTKVARQAGFGSALKDLRSFQYQLRTDLKTAKTNLRAARGAIEGRGTDLYPREFGGRFYPEEIGKELQAATRPVSLDTLQRLNNFFRPIMATADASFAGIQGLLTFFKNPQGYLEAMHAATLGGYDDLIKRMVDKGTYDRFIKAGGNYLSRNDLGEFLFDKSIQRYIPLAKVADTWFTRFGNAIRLLNFDAGLPLTRGAMDERNLARFANLISGMSIHDPSRLESIATFAPRFMRSQLGLLSDAFTDGTIAGKQARETLIKFITLGSLTTYGINKALGGITDTDPTSPNFMRIRALGQDISIFGPWDTLLRALSTSYSDGPIAGAEYLARSKASPVMGRLYDLIQGQTFSSSTPLDFSSTEGILKSLAAESEQVLIPISAQNTYRTFKRTGNFPQALASSGLQATGLKASSLTVSDQRDIVARREYGKDWRGLEPSQRAQLTEMRPDLDTSNQSSALAKRSQISKRFAALQAQVDANIPPGPDWREARSNLLQQQSGAFDQWAADHPDVATRLSSFKASNPNDQALNDYYQVFQEAHANSWTPEEITSAIDTLQQSWSKEQQAYVTRNTGLHDTPTVKQYRADQRILTPYWQIEDQVWARLRARPEFAQYETLQDYVDAQAESMLSRGIPQEQVLALISRLPVVSNINSAVARLRLQYRRVHPEADAALVKWYGSMPIKYRKAS